MDTLRTRPSADTFPLDDLVEFARSGRLRVPSFQRGLRWNRRDVVLLFDSILKGYPVGSLLLWEKDAPREEVTLGPLRIDAPEGPVYYVVDGQQRITALASALTEAGWVDQRFAVGYDLGTGSFTGRPARESDTWIPAHVLYDFSALLAWFHERSDLAGRFATAADVSKSLRDLRLPAYVVRQNDEEVLRAIFDRMNNAGKKLTRGEVFGALYRSHKDTKGITLRSVAEALQVETGFGQLADSLVMQLVLARRGPDVMREIRNEFEAGAKGRDTFAAEEEEEEAYYRTQEAAVLAVRFLQATGCIPHQAFLPYQYLLVALTRFFAHHPQPSERHKRLLRRFLWRAVVIGPSLVPGGTTGVSRAINRRIVPGDEVQSMRNLMDLVAGGAPVYPPIDPFKTNTASSKLLLCALWRHKPRGLLTNRTVTEVDLEGALGDQQTAIGVVTPLVTGQQSKGHERDAGNRLLLVPTEDQESDVVSVLSEVPPEVLASHLLEIEDVAALSHGQAFKVLARRAQRMLEVQREFLDEMCEWQQSDSADLELLVAEVGMTDALA